jgi:hypothetical protein
MSESTTPAGPAYSTILRAAGGLCSLAIPGLGQIIQGLVRSDRARLAKGILFLVGLNAMFVFGMWLGAGRNVYIPHQAEQLADEGKPSQLFGYQPPPLLNNIVLVRLQYSGQFWIGLAAWPALWNYYLPDEPILERYYASPGAVGIQRLPEEEREQLLRLRQTDPQEYRSQRQRLEREYRHTDLARREEELNKLQLAPDMGKLWDIGWVYTVIAGVLNILVIYDAWAGPIRLRPQPPSGTEGRKAP